MRKIVGFFSLLMFSSLLMILLNCNTISANFDSAKNYIKVTAGTENEQLKIGIHAVYQRGMAREIRYKVCLDNSDQMMTADACPSEWVKINFSGNDSDYISKETASQADKKLTTKFYSFNVSNVPAKETHKENYYTIFVQAYFCAVRSGGENGYTSCQYWHDNTYDENSGIVKYRFKVNEILNNDVDRIADEDLKSAMQKISDIVENIALPIIYVVLGLVLLIKGTITGVQIVKAADEPQVRQEKVHSLKWLVIGVSIGYAASLTVKLLLPFLKGLFGIE